MLLLLLLLGVAGYWYMLALARRRLRYRDPPVCVLSMDGGGTRGLVIAALLDEIEARVGFPLAECFDLVCGSSTGGVAALHLVHGAHPTSAVDEYRAARRLTEPLHAITVGKLGKFQALWWRKA